MKLDSRLNSLWDSQLSIEGADFFESVATYDESIPDQRDPSGLVLPENWESFHQVRKTEYISSRLLAQEVLSRRFSIAIDGLLNNEDRMPLWPRGIKGSLSHSKGKVAVGLTSSENVHSLGIDLEHLNRFEQLENNDRVISAQEVESLLGQGLSEAFFKVLVFSAKEAFYKAAFPLVHRFIGFKEVEIRSIDIRNKSFELVPLKKDLENLGRIVGRFESNDEFLLTRLFINKN